MSTRIQSRQAPSAAEGAPMGVLRRINHGYDPLEPVILGLMAMHRSFILIGRHGSGKTRLARILSLGHGNDGFVFYDATKDDLISIAGIPDVQSLTSGSLRFIPHERSIWNKTTIVVDELTRAGKESQNLWLEILEERTCFGLPLAYRTLIATANPESYAAAFQLDEALLDRFHAVVPVPEMQDGLTPDDVGTMVRLAAASATPDAREIAQVFALIRRAHVELLADGALERIAEYLAHFVPEMFSVLGRSDRRYVSARTWARNLPEAILAVSAYFRAAGAEEPLRLGALEAIRYALATKLQIRPAALEQIHRSVEGLLGQGAVPDADRLRLELSRLDSFERRLAFLDGHWEELTRIARTDEVEKIIGSALRDATVKGHRERLMQLRALLTRVGYAGDAVRQIDGQLVLVFRQALAAASPHLDAMVRAEASSPEEIRAQANARRFLELDARGALLSDPSPEVACLSQQLIALFDTGASADPGRLLHLFAGARLTGAA